jgi:hypothetical protein
MALTSANITDFNKLLNYFAGPIKLQYTGARAIKDGNSDNTFYTDNAHDDVNLDAGSANEDAIFSNTRLVPAETHCEFMSREYKTPANVNGKFTQLDAIDITGNKHYGHNKLYVLDVFLHSWLLGPNNLLDSAKTPNVNKFYKEYGISDFNKPLYKSVSTIPSLSVEDRFIYSGFQNFDMLNHLFITFITEPEAIAASAAAAAASAAALAAGAGEAAAEAAGEAAATASAVASAAAGGGPQSWWLTYMTDTYYTTNYSAMLLKNINFLWQMTLTYCHHAVTEITTIATRDHYVAAIFLLRHINFTEITSNNVLRFKCGYNAAPTPIEIFVAALVTSIDTNLGVPIPRQNIPVTAVMDWDAEQPTCGMAILSTLNTPAAPGSHPKIDPRGDNPSIDPAQLAAINGIAASYGALDARDIKTRMWSLLKFTGDTSHIVFAIIIQCAWDSFAKRKNFIIPSKAVAYREASNLNVFMLTGERPMMSRFINHNFSFMAKDTFVAVVDCTNQTPVLNRRKVFYYSTSIIAVAEQKVDEYTRKYNTPLELSSPEDAINALYKGQKALYDAFKASLRNPTDAVFNIDSDAKATAALTILSGQEYEYFYKCFDFLYAFSVLHNIDKDAIKLRCIELRKILFGIYDAKNGAFKPTQSILRNVDDSDFIDIDDISRQLNYIFYLFLIRDGPAITVPATPQATAISLTDWYDELEPSITNKIELIFVTLSVVLLAQCRNKSAMSAGSVEYSVENAGILTIIGSTCASQMQLFKGVVAPSTTDLMKVLEFTFSGISKSQTHKIDIINIFIYNLFALCSLCPSNLVYTTLRTTDKNAIKGSFDGDKFSLSIPIHAYNALYKEKNNTISCKQITKQIYIGGKISEECLDVIRSKIERLVEIKNNYIYEISKYKLLVLSSYHNIVKIDKLISSLNKLLIFTEETPTLILNCTLERGWARIRYEKLVGRELIGCIEEWISASIKQFLDDNAVFFTELERRGQTMKPNTLGASGKYIDLFDLYNEVNLHFQNTLEAYTAVVLADNNKLPSDVVAAKIMSCEIIPVPPSFNINWTDTDNVKIIVHWYNERNALSSSDYVLRAFIFICHAIYHHATYVQPLDDVVLSRLKFILPEITVPELRPLDAPKGTPNEDWDTFSRFTLAEIEFNRIDLIHQMLQIYEEYTKSLALYNLDELRKLPNYDQYIEYEYSNDETRWFDDLMKTCSFYYGTVPTYKEELVAPFVNFTWTEGNAIKLYNMVKMWKNINLNSDAIKYAYDEAARLHGFLPPNIQEALTASIVLSDPPQIIWANIDAIALVMNWYKRYSDNIENNDNLVLMYNDLNRNASSIISSIKELQLSPSFEYILRRTLAELRQPDGSLLLTRVDRVDDLVYAWYCIHNVLPEHLDVAYSFVRQLYKILPSQIKQAYDDSYRENTEYIVNWAIPEQVNIIMNWFNMLRNRSEKAYTQALSMRGSLPPNIEQALTASFVFSHPPRINWESTVAIAMVVDWYDKFVEVKSAEAIEAYAEAVRLRGSLPPNIEEALTASIVSLEPPQINWARTDSIALVIKWYTYYKKNKNIIMESYTEAVRLRESLPPNIEEALTASIASLEPLQINWANTAAHALVMNWYNRLKKYEKPTYEAYAEAVRLRGSLPPNIEEALTATIVSLVPPQINWANTDAIALVVNWDDKRKKNMYYRKKNEVYVNQAYTEAVRLRGSLPPIIEQALAASIASLEPPQINWESTVAIAMVVDWYDKYRMCSWEQNQAEVNRAYAEAVRLRGSLPPNIEEALTASIVSLVPPQINWAITESIATIVNWYDKYRMYQSRQNEVLEAYTQLQPLRRYLPDDIKGIFDNSLIPAGNPDAGSINFTRTDEIEAVMLFYSSEIELYKKIHRAILTLKDYMKIGIIPEEVRTICERIEINNVIDYSSDDITALMDWYNGVYHQYVIANEFNKTLLHINHYIHENKLETFDQDVLRAFRSVTRDNPTVNIETIDWGQVDNIKIVLNWNTHKIGTILFGGRRKKNSGSKKSKKIVKSKKNKLVKMNTIKKRKILKKIKKSKKNKHIKRTTIKHK